MFIVRIMVVIARHIIDVIVALLLKNITPLAQSGWGLEICKFIGHGYIIYLGKIPIKTMRSTRSKTKTIQNSQYKA